MAQLRLENIAKNFGKVSALTDINLSIKAGTFCVILGPSGCGKSTLLNLVAGLEEPSGGKIYLGDKDITGLAPYRRNIAMVFQNYALYPHLSVFENIAFGLRAKGEKKKIIEDKVGVVSRTLDINDKLGKFPRELSGGEKQRVATGRAIVREPELFLFDEPLSNLDARLRIELRAEFIKLHQRLKKTILYVTHDQVEAMSLGQEVVVLKEGKIMQISSPQELYNNPACLFVAEFIGTPPMNIIRFSLRKSAETMKLTKGDFSLGLSDEFKKGLEFYIGQDLYMGFRASALKLDGPDKIKAEVVFSETIGEDSFCRVRIHPEIELTLETYAPLKPKEHIYISIDNSKVFLFDSHQKRIYL